MDMYQLYQQPMWLLLILLGIILWDLIWRGIALWYAALNRQKGWFIAILLINSIGILPIIYLIGFKPKRITQSVVMTKSVKNGKRKR